MSVVLIPPGEGSKRTRRNNQAKRKKQRAKLVEEVHERFLQAVQRAQQRAAGQVVDEDDWHGAYVLDVVGATVEHDTRPNFLSASLQVAELDLEAYMPPGGGSLGFPPLEHVAAGARADTLAGASTEVVPPQRQRKTQQQRRASAAPVRKRIQPPSQRSDPIPPNVRLRRVDCDECVTPWPDEEDVAMSRDSTQHTVEESPAVVAAPEDDFAAMYAAMGLPVSFGKQQGWDGNSLLTSTCLPNRRHECEAAAEATNVKTEPLSDTLLLDYGSADEELPAVSQQRDHSTVASSTLPAAASVPVLEGGEQEAIDTSLQVLRLLHAHRSATNDLARAREAALASLKAKAKTVS